MRARPLLVLPGAIALIALLSYAAHFLIPRTQTGPTVHIGGVTVNVMIAATDAERELGLGGREGLAENEGMLFVFPDDAVHHFWMKDMRFSIDIIWISADGTIVYIEPDLSPETYPRAYGPETPVRYVLEVSAGFAERHHVAVGDYVGL